MTELRNPYTPPRDASPAAIDAPLYAKPPKTLVMRVGASLPDRCLRCGKPTAQRRSTKVSAFEATSIAVLLVANALGIGVVAMMGLRGAIWLVALLLSSLVWVFARTARRSATLELPDCRDHPRWLGTALHYSTSAFPLLVIIAQASFEGLRPPERLLGLPGWVWLPAASYGLHLFLTIVWPLPYPMPRAKLEEGHFHVSPVVPAVLEKLPPWPGG